MKQEWIKEKCNSETNIQKEMKMKFEDDTVDQEESSRGFYFYAYFSFSSTDEKDSNIGRPVI